MRETTVDRWLRTGFKHTWMYVRSDGVYCMQAEYGNHKWAVYDANSVQLSDGFKSLGAAQAWADEHV